MHPVVLPSLQAQAEVLGKLQGESVKMLVHHSRNSEQKQVTALAFTLASVVPLIAAAVVRM